MSMDNIEDTSPVHIQSENKQPAEVEVEEKPRKRRIGLWILAGLVVVIFLTVLGGLYGYYTALQRRLVAEAEQVALVTTTQYQLGLADLEAGRYEMARNRFEYVIELDPDFPDASAKLQETMLKMAVVATPTVANTPTPDFTPTPDLRGEEELFNAAWTLYVNQDWDNTINTLDQLRKLNLNYRTIEVDGMYYMALRYRGIQKIAGGSLEPGIYDLALSETFAPLDREADGFRNFARYYLTGASFWGVDWAKVLEYFTEISASLPNLRDGAGWTAVERYRFASVKYGDQLAAKGDYCAARDQYNNALSIGGDDNLPATATAVQLECEPPTATPGPPTEEPTVDETAPVEETEPAPEETTIAPDTTPDTEETEITSSGT